MEGIGEVKSNWKRAGLVHDHWKRGSDIEHSLHVQEPSIVPRYFQNLQSKAHFEVAICHKPQTIAVTTKCTCHGCNEGHTANKSWNPEILGYLSLGILYNGVPWKSALTKFQGWHSSQNLCPWLARMQGRTSRSMCKITLQKDVCKTCVEMNKTLLRGDLSANIHSYYGSA